MLHVTDAMQHKDMEEELIADVIGYTSRLVCDVVRPSSVVFISIDGPVPMGKIVKQRARRYKKVQDDAYVRKLYTRYDEKLPLKFNSNSITPGTQFMSKLCARLRSCIKLGVFSKHRHRNNFKVFLSDSNIAGEGEQKIFDFIANGKMKENGLYPKVTIYGLDADLIMLSMISKCTGIRLIREPQNSSTELAQYHDTDFLYLNIDKCTDALLKEYKLDLYERSEVIRDFVFLAFLGGNDFVDPLFNCKMRDSGLDTLCVLYANAIKECNSTLLDEHNVPRRKVILHILSGIARNEDHFAKRAAKKIQQRHTRTPHHDASTKDKINYSVQLYEHSLYTDRTNPYHAYYSDSLNSINLESNYADWKSQYNTLYFRDANNKDVCIAYLKCIKWTHIYYCSANPPSWLWEYVYRNSPLASSLCEYISALDDNAFGRLWNSFIFPKDIALSPIQQLVAVTPPQHNGILPFSLRIVIKDRQLGLDHMFPRNVKLDVTKGLKNIYSEPILCPVDVTTIRKMMLTFPFSEHELNRDKTSSSVFCHKI